MEKQLVFLKDKKIKKAFEEIVDCIVPNSEIYLVSGSVRNSIYYKFFQKKLPQRDFDAVVIWNPHTFINNLKNKWWSDDNKIKKTNWIILHKAKQWIKDTKHNFKNYVFLDLIFSKPKRRIRSNLRNNANFTLNWWAINLKDIFSKDRFEKLIILPLTIEDIKNKTIRLNNKHNCDWTNIFACIRFMSQWFKKPKKEETNLMLKAMKSLSKERFERNIPKLFDYVGWENNARKLLKKLWITKDIFNYETVNNLL